MNSCVSRREPDVAKAERQRASWQVVQREITAVARELFAAQRWNRDYAVWNGEAMFGVANDADYDNGGGSLCAGHVTERSEERAGYRGFDAREDASPVVLEKTDHVRAALGSTSGQG